MKSQNTLIVLLAAAVILIVYDIYATMKGVEYTITYLIRIISKDHPIIPWIIGFLCGSWSSKITKGN